MKEFDYMAAWRELAKPSFDALSPEVRELFRYVRDNGAEWKQNVALDVPFPADGALLRDFQAVPTRELANAARTIYYFGHWNFSRSGDYGPSHGENWKFSSLADQVLSAALGLRGPHELEGQGISLRVHEGYIRVQASSHDAWTWEEVGPATPEVLEAVRSVAQPLTPNRRRNWRDSWKDFDAALPAYMEAVKAAARAVLTPSEAAWLDTARFMREPIVAGSENCCEREAYERARANGRAFSEPRYLPHDLRFGRCDFCGAVDEFTKKMRA